MFGVTRRRMPQYLDANAKNGYRLAIAICLLIVFIQHVSYKKNANGLEHLDSKSAGLNWEGNGISESSQGKLFKLKKIRSFDGDKNFQSTPTKTTDYPLMTKSCDKWAVVTTIFEPTETIRGLAKLPDWCVCVCGDKKSPKNYEVPGIVYLDVKSQEELPYGIVKLLRWNHFGRKNIGFLYAIHHGAKYVYDTDDDNVLKSLEVGIPLLKNATYSELATESKVINPYVYFNPVAPNRVSKASAAADHFMWPRGIPLEAIRDEKTYELSMGKTIPADTIGVIQSLADKDPDVDGIYRLTNTLPVNFAKKDSLVVLPQNSFAPFNAQAVTFTQSTLWGLLLPVTVHGRVTDIWRSYFTERIMWDIGKQLSFASPWVTQFRNVHSYQADFNSEIPLYTQAEELVKYLGEWSSQATSVAGRMEQMAIDVYEAGIIEEDDVLLMQMWIQDLINVGYEFPKIV